MASLAANAYFEWEAFGLGSKQSEGAAMVIGLLAIVFILPTQRELSSWQRRARDGKGK